MARVLPVDVFRIQGKPLAPVNARIEQTAHGMRHLCPRFTLPEGFGVYEALDELDSKAK